MPFEIGNPGGPGGGHTGPQRAKQRSLRLLAMEIREDPRHKGLVDKLYKMADGVDPVTNERIDMGAVQNAIKLLMLYGHGQPAQHVVLEGSIRNEMIQIEPREHRERMTLEEVNARRAQLRAIGVRPKVIDVEEQPAQLQLEAGGDDAES